jgi:protease-4
MTRDARFVLVILFAAFSGLLITILLTVSRIGGTYQGTVFAPWEDRIARVDIVGDITDAEPVVEELHHWAADRSVRALLVRIDSPGGGVAASQEIYRELERYREETGRPVVASLGSLAASGGYYVALGADEIIAAPGTITGSIGVIMTFPNTEELFEKVGLRMEVVKSAEHKDLGSPFRSMNEGDRKILQSLIDDAYDQFTEAVMDARSMERDKVMGLADGSVFTGRQAKDLGLVDDVGTLEDATRRAADLAGIHGEPTIVRRRQPPRLIEQLLGGLVGPGARALRMGEAPRLEYRWTW